MKTKIILFAMLVLMVACNQEQPVRNCKGSIVGTLGCYDKETRTTFYKGYIILTSNNDTILSFNLDVNDTINVQYGETDFSSPITIPYKFSYEILSSNDERYVHFADIIQDAMRPGPAYPTCVNKQAMITPCK